MLSAFERQLVYKLQELSETGNDVRVFWWKVGGSRNNFKELLKKEFQGFSIVPLVPTSGFQNPNALLSDLSLLMKEYRDDVSEVEYNSGSLIFLMISHAPLAIPQVSSPMTMPEFVPGVGGQIVDVFIEDVLNKIVAPIGSDVSNIPCLSERLWELEYSLVNTLKRNSVESDSYVTEFMELLKKGNEGSIDWVEFLGKSYKYLNDVTDRRSFRPTASAQYALSPRITRVYESTEPRKLNTISGQFQKALQMTCDVSESRYEWMLSILQRTPDRRNDISNSFGRGLLVCIAAVYKFLTAAHHSDDYCEQNAELLRAITAEFCRMMEMYEAEL